MKVKTCVKGVYFGRTGTCGVLHGEGTKTRKRGENESVLNSCGGREEVKESRTLRYVRTLGMTHCDLKGIWIPVYTESRMESGSHQEFGEASNLVVGPVGTFRSATSL